MSGCAALIAARSLDGVDKRTKLFDQMWLEKISDVIVAPSRIQHTFVVTLHHADAARRGCDRTRFANTTGT